MRISDWSSDVCSSDLRRPLGDLVAGGNVPALTAVAIGPVMEGAADIVADDLAADAEVRAHMLAISGHRPDCTVFSAIDDDAPVPDIATYDLARSEVRRKGDRKPALMQIGSAALRARVCQ